MAAGTWMEVILFLRYQCAPSLLSERPNRSSREREVLEA
jgi:hypothetical protein